jgi:hypothetical protein
MSKSTKTRWGVQQRLEFIEFRLFWEGRFNRADLVKQFGVSIPQASADISQYQEKAPGNIEYNRKEKAYFPISEYKPVLIKPNADLYLSQLTSLSNGLIREEETYIEPIPKFDILHGFQQSVNPKILRTVLYAINNKKAIEVEYQSLSNPKPTWRWISPHAIASDQFRWHTRAFCHNRFDFRDFVLTRILNIRGKNHSYSNPEDDEAWNTFVTVKIGPHPELSTKQKKVIELDYGMTKGKTELSIRKSLLFYFVQQNGFLADDEKNRAPIIQQIVLLNREEVQQHLPQKKNLI